MMGITYPNEPITEVLPEAGAGERGPVSAAGRRLFALLGGASALGYLEAVLLVRSDYTAADFLRFFSIFFLLACLWGLAVWLARRVEPARGVVLAGAVLFRLLLLAAGFSPETGRFRQDLLYGGETWRIAGDTWPAVLACKAGVAAFDMAAVWLVMRLAGPGARGTAALLAYAWNPLAIKEFAGSGHFDAALICPVLALMVAGGRAARVGVLLLAAAGGALAVLAPGPRPPLFSLLPAGRTGQLAVGGAVVVAVALWRRRDSVCRYAVWVLGTLLLVTPAFAAWRITWLLPFAALEGSWFWLALSGSVFLSYHTGLSFREIPALTMLEFAMPVLVWMWIRRKDLPGPPGDPYN